MKSRLVAVFPYGVIAYLAAAFAIACDPPWVGGTSAVFLGHFPLWVRVNPLVPWHGVLLSTGYLRLDWSMIALELLAVLVLVAIALLVGALLLRWWEAKEISHTAGHIDCPACDAMRDQIAGWTKPLAERIAR